MKPHFVNENFDRFLLFEIENIMNDQTKTKAELVKELQEVRKERDALKASRGKDIIENNLAEEVLRESEGNFRSIFENNPTAMSLIEPDTTISMVNEEYCKASGYAKQDVIGTSWTQQIPPQDLERLKEYNRSRLINPKDTPDKYEFTFYHKNGEIRNSMMSITILSNGKRVASFIDNTDRKLAEKALYDSREDLHRLLNSMAEGAYGVDITGNCTFINRSFLQILGYQNEDEVLGKHIHDLIHHSYSDGSPHPPSDCIIYNTLQRINSSDDVLWRKDGVAIPVEFWAYPIEKDGVGIGSIVTFIDITERKKAEEELRLKTEQLYAANAEKDKFFSIIAHDLRSPFNSLLGFTELLDKELPTMTRDQIQQIAVTMRKSATNLYALLENLLEYSRLQRGLIPFNPEPILLMPKVLADTVFVMESANKKEITLNYDIPDDLKVYADDNMLGGILRNLASNAVKFTPKGGKVNISAKSLDHTVECSVSDTGIGMNKAMKENLFNMDVNTSRNGTDKEPSTGLGLILCKEHIEKHGGKLMVESEEGKGSTFYFTLPSKKDKAPKQ